MSGRTEKTSIGAQYLVTGVEPATEKDRLNLRAASPLRGPRRNPDISQKPCNHGLFDECQRAQTDLVDLLRQSRPEISTSKEGE